MTQGDKIMEAVSPLADAGDLVAQVVVILHVITPEGDDVLKLLATECPWWTVNGMIDGARLIMDDVVKEL